MNTTCLATGMFRRRLTTACTPFGRLRTFRSPASRFPPYPELINALAAIKQAAALANIELGLLDRKRGDAIIAACIEMRAGRLAR